MMSMKGFLAALVSSAAFCEAAVGGLCDLQSRIDAAAKSGGGRQDL